MTSTKWQRAITSLVPTLVLPPEVIQYTNMAVLAITAACFTLTYRNRFATALRIFLAIPALYYSYVVGFGWLNSPNRRVSPM